MISNLPRCAQPTLQVSVVSVAAEGWLHGGERAVHSTSSALNWSSSESYSARAILSASIALAIAWTSRVYSGFTASLTFVEAAPFAALRRAESTANAAAMSAVSVVISLTRRRGALSCDQAAASKFSTLSLSAVGTFAFASAAAAQTCCLAPRSA